MPRFQCATSRGGLTFRPANHDETDQARGSLDRRVTYIVTAYIADAAR